MSIRHHLPDRRAPSADAISASGPAPGSLLAKSALSAFSCRPVHAQPMNPFSSIHHLSTAFGLCCEYKPALPVVIKLSRYPQRVSRHTPVARVPAITAMPSQACAYSGSLLRACR